MLKKLKYLATTTLLAIIVSFSSAVFFPPSLASAVTTDPAVKSGNCSDVSKCDLITKYINPFINFLAALVGVAVTISVIVGGIQYASSGGDPQKVAAAKGRIRNSLIALLVFIFLYSLISFLIPGGLI